MDEPRITLKELQELISDTIHTEIDSHFWVTAEISECNSNYSGHCYLELIEKNKKDKAISARIRATIWSRKARFLLPFFKTSAGIDLGEGISILVKGKLEYHAVYGISLNIVDIDPKYTIGDLAEKRNEILNRLKSEGVLDMNKELSLAPHPKRVAVVSSEEAAGYQDFKDHLLNNQFAYNYTLDLFTAIMQGTETEKSVLDSLSQISESISLFDIVVIVRGGGSQADLSWFDNYEIAYFITQFPIPVISGIGHDKDISVTDIVAHTSCKTPTAVADFILEQTSETERYMNSLGREIVKSAKTHLDRSKLYLNGINNKITSSSRLNLSTRKVLLRHKGELIKAGASRVVQTNFSILSNLSTVCKTEPKKLLLNLGTRINNISRAVKYLSPEKVLERGYSITLHNGKSLKDSTNIENGDNITTVLHNGRIESEVFDIKE